MLDFDSWCNEQLYDFKQYLDSTISSKERRNKVYNDVSKFCSVLITRCHEYPENISMYKGSVIMKINCIKKLLK